MGVEDLFSSAYRLVDLTWALTEDMPHHPAHPRGPFILSGTLSHPLSRAWLRKTTRYGPLSFANEQIILSGHTGTHIDAPFHFHPEGCTVEEIPLGYTCGPGSWLNVNWRCEPRNLISATDLDTALGNLGTELQPITLIYSGWSRRIESNPREYFESSVGLSEDAAIWLRQHGVRTVGIDAPSVDPPNSECPAHLHFLRPREGEDFICVIENLVRIETIGRSSFFFIGMPLPIKGSSGSPIRAVALVSCR